MAILVATTALAQTADDHAAHHPPGAAAPAEASSARAGSGSSHEADDVCCGQDGDLPLFSALLRLDPLDPEGRRRLTNLADDRINRGLSAVEAGVRAARRATSFEDRRRAGETLREGLSDFESGAVARSALVSDGPTREAALDLPPPSGPC